MRIQIVAPAAGPSDGRFYAASFLVDEQLAVDAGGIGFLSPLERQKRIRHVFLSHSHMDHIGSLPLFLDNVYEPGPDCPLVYASSAVLDCLRSHLFNDRIWPDFVRLSTEETPFLRSVVLEPGRPVAAAGLTVTPVALNHTVPTLGFILETPASAVAIVCDTDATEEIWQMLRAKPHLKAVFLEAAFPESMAWLAKKSKHLTPAVLQSEVAKLARQVPVIAVQIKPAFQDQVVAELQALGLAGLQVGVPGVSYEF